MEIEDSEIFEITDYTNISDWEKFISKLEEAITYLEHSQLDEDPNIVFNETLKFENYCLSAMFINPKILTFDDVDLASDDSNTLEIGQSLVIKPGQKTISEEENFISWEMVKWFGKKKYIVICPSNQTIIYDQAHIKQLISSVMIAVTNLKCQLPVIIKYGPKNWPLYEGVFLDNDFKGKLQSAVIKYTPKQCNHLSGIRRMFQEKLGKGYVLDDEISLSAKYLFNIENCPIRNDYYFKGQFSPQKKMHFFQFMTAGFTKDPIKSFKLFAHWPKVAKEILSHLEHSSLPVSSASQWFLSSVTEYSYDGLLYKTLRKLLKSFLIAQKSGEILRDAAINHNVRNINQPLLKLTKSPIANHSFFQKTFIDQINFTNISENSSHAGDNSFLDESVLQDILLFLFPDARSNGEAIQQPYSRKYQTGLPNYEKLKKKLQNANCNHLLHRLAVCMTNLLTYHKEGIKCFSYIWQEVVLELRHRWENGIVLSETRMSELYKQTEDDNCDNKDEIYSKLLQDSMPHLAACQLEQQLKMLNYCILTRLRNQYLQKCDNTNVNESSDSDEQFFDCETEADEMSQEPRGRLRKHGSHHLINHPDVPLYIPITQVLPVDVLKGSRKREADESMQASHSSSLVADMSAFKAANPGCIIEDFIRWYSPNDFVEKSLDVDHLNNSSEVTGITKSGLSCRMQVADNTWLRSWEKSSPVPARLQKRLFDDTTAAENVLFWLNNLTIAEISSSLMNNVLLDSLDALVECIEDHDPPDLINEIDMAASAIIRFLDSTDIIDITGAELEYYQSYDQLILNFQRIEYTFAIKRSLYHKFIPEYNGSIDGKDEIIEIINTIMVPNAEMLISKKILTSLNYEYLFGRLVSLYLLGNKDVNNSETFYEVDRIFTNTNQKEYVVSLACSYPLATSRKSNQRLYICSNEEEFRVATHMLEDLTYF